jgi:3'(2'), 5'-bisphosphate nucleotidase
MPDTKSFDLMELTGELEALARLAGAAIMAVYHGKIEVEQKADSSPVTAADRAAHEVIAEGLERLTPDIPVLSEEGRDIAREERSGWDRLWVVDPLDGTKEFIKRNGEFTVNIALVQGHRVVWGVVYAPALDRAYWGGADFGAFRREGKGPAQQLRTAPCPEGAKPVVVKSRSHPSPELERYLDGLGPIESVAVGSSLKLCAVAEGRAHIYPRLGPTMEWDIAAGQAVLEGAGGRVLTPEGAAFRYNKPELLNGHFIADGGYDLPREGESAR